MGWRRIETLLHGLHLFGAAGIAAFGWALCFLLHWPATPWLLLWFCAALVIYNTDRLRRDPADEINVPLRDATGRRIRPVRMGVLAVAALILVLQPWLARDWITLSLVALGALVCLNYSIPLFGFRFKEVPWLKTFFAPTIVAAAILGLPWAHGFTPHDPIGFLVATLRAWAFLLFNMTLCDMRDLAGDESTGVKSLPALLGPQRTRLFLWLLLWAMEGLALVSMFTSAGELRLAWILMAAGGPIYLGLLLRAVRRPQPEPFYEWWVEGMLFLPAGACLISRMALAAF